jgi:hypothetical protein
LGHRARDFLDILPIWVASEGVVIQLSRVHFAQ